jgi:hypothetical protein
MGREKRKQELKVKCEVGSESDVDSGKLPADSVLRIQIRIRSGIL